MPLSLLLVEDNLKTREQIIEILAQTPFHIDVAVDGLAGLNQARLARYDIIVVDHKMPLMDGLLLIKNLRDIESYMEIPILLMTTAEPEQIREKAERVGATYVFGKPLETAEFLDKIKQFLPRDVA